MDPNAIQQWLQGNALIVMFVAGLAVKYLPFLKAIPNKLIPWINLIGYILISVLGGTAQADSTAVVPLAVVAHPTFLTILLKGVLNALMAALFYDKAVKEFIPAPRFTK
jgi:hypothetical protein